MVGNSSIMPTMIHRRRRLKASSCLWMGGVFLDHHNLALMTVPILVSFRVEQAVHVDDHVFGVR